LRGQPTATADSADSAVLAAAEHQARAYIAFFGELLQSFDIAAVCRVVDTLRDARDRGATVYIAGNGGSAATASHLANDLGKAAKRSGQRPFKVMSLSDNVAWITALANDEGYERVFSGQLENFAAPGDVLIVISASGNSPNLLEAVQHAQRNGVRTVGVLGFDGGALLSVVDEAVWVETAPGVYGPVETAHVLLCDVISTCLIEDRAALGES
jgi:D-sedoheptulose 7-phosphate isomerase